MRGLLLFRPSGSNERNRGQKLSGTEVWGHLKILVLDLPGKEANSARKWLFLVLFWNLIILIPLLYHKKKLCHCLEATHEDVTKAREDT